MTPEKFEEYQELYTEIERLNRWVIHASMSNLAPITRRENLPEELRIKIHRTILKMAEEHLKKLENEFEHLELK